MRGLRLIGPSISVLLCGALLTLNPACTASVSSDTGSSSLDAEGLELLPDFDLPLDGLTEALKDGKGFLRLAEQSRCVDNAIDDDDFEYCISAVLGVEADRSTDEDLVTWIINTVTGNEGGPETLAAVDLTSADPKELSAAVSLFALMGLDETAIELAPDLAAQPLLLGAATTMSLGTLGSQSLLQSLFGITPAQATGALAALGKVALIAGAFLAVAALTMMVTVPQREMLFRHGSTSLAAVLELTHATLALISQAHHMLAAGEHVSLVQFYTMLQPVIEAARTAQAELEMAGVALEQANAATTSFLKNPAVFLTVEFAIGTVLFTFVPIAESVATEVALNSLATVSPAVLAGHLEVTMEQFGAGIALGMLMGLAAVPVVNAVAAAGVALPPLDDGLDGLYNDPTRTKAAELLAGSQYWWFLEGTSNGKPDWEGGSCFDSKRFFWSQRPATILQRNKLGDVLRHVRANLTGEVGPVPSFGGRVVQAVFSGLSKLSGPAWGGLTSRVPHLAKLAGLANFISDHQAPFPVPFLVRVIGSILARLFCAIPDIFSGSLRAAARGIVTLIGLGALIVFSTSDLRRGLWDTAKEHLEAESLEQFYQRIVERLDDAK